MKSFNAIEPFTIHIDDVLTALDALPPKQQKTVSLFLNESMAQTSALMNHNTVLMTAQSRLNARWGSILFAAAALGWVSGILFMGVTQ